MPERTHRSNTDQGPPLAARWLLAILAIAAAASADTPPLSGGEFTIRRATIDTGGGASSGVEFALRGTIGQADAGEHDGGELKLQGGFWTSEGKLTDVIFSDGFEGVRPKPNASGTD